jgi:hypothetical protein
MKIWWVLVWENYYPEGELDNVKGMYLTEPEAIAAANEYKTKAWDNVRVINILEFMNSFHNS